MNNKQDIETREDIETIITLFYKYAFEDDLLGEIFTKISPLHLEKHIPIVTNFWEGILFDKFLYKGNVVEKHFETNYKIKLTQNYFDRWIAIWKKSIDELFDGEKATIAKTRASSIADIMFYKLDFMNKK